MEKVEFGSTGLQVSPLNFGTGTNGWNHHSNQGDLGVDQLSYLLRFAHERGITFWDTADQYGTHPHVAAALREVDRESTTIATKTVAGDARSVAKDVERFLSELDAEHLDIVLFHGISDANWPAKMQGAMDALSEYKNQGLIRAVGISCHSLGALQAAAETEWLDVILVRINHAGRLMDGAPDRVVPLLNQIAAAGKGVYGMKVLGRGSLEDPAQAIRYALGLSSVHAVTIGMMNEEEILENIDLVGRLAPA